MDEDFRKGGTEAERYRWCYVGSHIDSSIAIKDMGEGECRVKHNAKVTISKGSR